MTIDGVTKKYYVQEVNKFNTIENAGLLNTGTFSILGLSSEQECNECDGPYPEIYTIVFYPGCSTPEIVSPNNHDLYLNGTYIGTIRYNHWEGVSINNNYVDSFYMFIASTDTDLVVEDDSLFSYNEYLTRQVFFFNPSLFIMGSNSLVVKRSKEPWEYSLGNAIFSTPTEIFFKNIEGFLNCSQFRDCITFPSTQECIQLIDYPGDMVGYEWEFMYDGPEYVPGCVAIPTTTPIPTTTSPPTTTPLPTTVAPPTTTPPPPTTTVGPTTTVLPTTVPPPTTTVAPPPTTTVVPTTTVIPTTVPPPTTTMGPAPTTTVAPTTVAPTTSPPSPTTTPPP